MLMSSDEVIGFLRHLSTTGVLVTKRIVKLRLLEIRHIAYLRWYHRFPQVGKLRIFI